MLTVMGIRQKRREDANPKLSMRKPKSMGLTEPVIVNAPINMPYIAPVPKFVPNLVSSIVCEITHPEVNPPKSKTAT